MTRASRTENVISAVAAASALLMSGVVLFGPMYASRSTTIGASGQENALVATTGALAVNGWRILPWVLLPVGLAAMPLLWQRHPARGVVTAINMVLLFGFCVIAGFSIGMLYVPTLLIMLAGSVVSGLRRRRHTPG